MLDRTLVNGVALFSQVAALSWLYQETLAGTKYKKFKNHIAVFPTLLLTAYNGSFFGDITIAEVCWGARFRPAGGGDSMIFLWVRLSKLYRGSLAPLVLMMDGGSVRCSYLRFLRCCNRKSASWSLLPRLLCVSVLRELLSSSNTSSFSP